jgi:hypothetical protein
VLAGAAEQEARERRDVLLAIRLDDAPVDSDAIDPARIAADFRGVDWDDPQDPTFPRELACLLSRL